MWINSRFISYVPVHVNCFDWIEISLKEKGDLNKLPHWNWSGETISSVSEKDATQTTMYAIETEKYGKHLLCLLKRRNPSN